MIRNGTYMFHVHVDYWYVHGGTRSHCTRAHARARPAPGRACVSKGLCVDPRASEAARATDTNVFAARSIVRDQGAHTRCGVEGGSSARSYLACVPPPVAVRREAPPAAVRREAVR